MLPKISHVFRLSRDPELRYTNQGMAVCRVGLVASEKRGDEEKQIWIDGTAFGKTAEHLHNISKGQRVFVAGRLQTDQWLDNNSSKRSKTALIIDMFECIEKKERAQNGVTVEYRDKNGNMEGQETIDPNIEIDDDDIPL